MKLVAVALLVMVLSTGTAQAVQNGSQLRDMCSQAIRDNQGEGIESIMSMSGMICAGYIMGVADEHLTLRVTLAQLENHEMQCTFVKDKERRTFTLDALARVARVDYCMPDHTTLTQKIKAVVDYLKGHPDELQLPPNGLIGEAFVAAFPCPGETGAK